MRPVEIIKVFPFIEFCNEIDVTFERAWLARGEVSKPRESLNSTHAFSMAQMPLGFVPTLKESL